MRNISTKMSQALKNKLNLTPSFLSDGSVLKSLSLTALMLMSVLLVNAQTFGANEIEPNGTPATASPIVTNPAKVQGYIYGNGDVDYYSFSATAGDKVYAAVMTSFSAGSSTDCQLTLLASDGTTVIEFDDDNGSMAGLSSSIAGAVIPITGTYYLKVNDFTAGTTTERPYFLYLKVQSGSPVAEVESNDVFGSANLVPASGWISGSRGVASATEQDWYAITLAAGESVFLSLDLDPERDGTVWNGRLGFALFGDAGNQILVVDDAGTGDVSPNPNIPSEAFFFTAKDAGTYYVFVDAASAAVGGATATYNVSVSKFAAQSGYVNYAYTGAATAIGPGAGLISSTITIPDNKTIKDLSVRLNLTHALMADLDVTLTSPNGNIVHLFTDIGAAATGGQNQMDLVLNDNNGCPPLFTVLKGVGLQPELAAHLDYFKGMKTAGNWRLTIADDLTNASGGTLNGWSLDVLEDDTVALLNTYTPLFNEDFETTDGAFTHSGTADEWAWGTPATPATNTANPVAAFNTANSGVKCWKTDLTGTYNVSSDQVLESPNIDLTAQTGPLFVSWAMKYQMESASFDALSVTVEEVGGSGLVKEVFRWYGPTQTATIGNPTVNTPLSAGWGTYWSNVSAFAGKTIRLKVRLVSDNTVNFGGVAIDDVKLLQGCTISPLCRNTTIYLNGSGSATLLADSIDNGSTATCGIDTKTLSQSTFGCGNVGANSVKLYITDSGGKVDSCTATVTVLDTTKPSITCPADLTLYTNEINCGIFEYHFFDTATAADNCGGVSVITPQQDQDFAVGVHTITWIATDASGNVDSCHQTLTVLDTVRPVITCPADISVSNDAGICGAVVTFAKPTATDNCGGGVSVSDSSVFTFTGGTEIFTVPAGVTSVTISAFGAQGGKGQSTLGGNGGKGGSATGTLAVTPGQTLYVNVGGQNGYNGGGQPGISGPFASASGGGASDVRVGVNSLANRVIVAGGGGGGTGEPQGTCTSGPGGNGGNGGDLVGGNGTDGSGCGVGGRFGTGGTQVDGGNGGAGNSNCSGTSGSGVSGVLGIGGIGGNGIQGCGGFTGSGGGGGGGGYYGGAGGGGGNGGGGGAWSGGGGGGGSSYIGGVTSGSTTNGAQNGNGRVVISYTFSTTVTQIAGPTSGSTFPKGTSIVTFVATDTSGNTDTCSFNVTVSDTSKPTAVCQNVTVQLDGSGNASITTAQVNNGSTDNCAIKSVVASPLTFTCANLGANTVTLTVTDSSNNVSTCTATVTVQDTTKPTAVCQGLTVYLDGTGNASITASQIDNGSTDDCSGIDSITVSPATFSCSNTGANTVTLTVKDSSGNVSACTATVTVLDTIAPVITCPGDISVSNDAGICGAVVTFTDPTATDNCGGGASIADSSVFNFTGGAQTFTVPAGVTSLSIKAAGAKGGDVTGFSGGIGGKGAIMQGDFVVTPGDVLTIIVGGQGSSSISTSGGGGGSGVNNGATAMIVAGGGGGVDYQDQNYAGRDAVVTSNGVNGNGFSGAAGGTSGSDGGDIAYTPNDISRGGRGWNFGPSGSLGANGISLSGAPTTNGTWGLGGGGGSVGEGWCNCGAGGGGYSGGGAGAINTSGGGGGSYNIGTNQVNTGGANASEGRVVLYYTTTGNSVTVTQIAGLVSGSTFPKGTSVVTYVATDPSGNTDTCSFNVTVSDTSKPTAVCQNVTVQLDGTGNASITASQVDNGSTDNCAIKSITASPLAFTCANLGANSVTLTVTDSSNNVSTCTATVTVQDTTLPTITCPSNITVNKDAGVCGAVVTFSLTGTDNCGTPTITSSPASGSLFPVGTTTVNDTARDAAGNIAVCSFTVTVNPPFDSVQNVTICRGDTIAPGAGLVAFGSCGGTTTITATTQVFPGTTVGASTYNRSVSGSSYSASGVGTDVNWDTVRFTVPITGVYVVNADAIGYDGFLTLHQSSFNPASPATGFVFASDDSIGTDGAMRRTLTAGVTYYAVVSAFDNGDAGPYSLSVVPQFTGSITVSGKPIWYNTPTGGTALASDSVFNPIGVPGSGLANSDTFGVFNHYVACPSDSGCRRLVTLTINNAPTVNQVANQRLCLGGSTVAANFTGAVANTTYNWTNSNPAIGLPASGSGDIASFVPTAAGVAVITVTPSNATTACPTGKAIIFTIRVDSVSVGGTVGPDSSFCSTTNTGDLFLKGYTGTIVRWEISTNGGATWTNVAITGNAVTYTDLDSTTLVRALVKSGVCDSAYSTPATITIFNGPTSATLSTNPGPQFLISENFTGSNPPAGWLTRNNSNPVGSTGWFRGNPTVFVANSSPDSSYIAANYNSTGTFGDISNWLILPNITLKNGDNFSFFTRTSDFPQFADNLQVRMSTNGASSNVGTTSASVGDFTNLLLDINPGLIPTTYPNNWKQYTLTISGLSGPTSGRLAFRYVVPDGGLFGDNSDYIGIDDVQYSSPAAPICSGDTVSIKVSVTSGAGPFEVVYTDGFNNYTESNYVSGTAINVVPTQNVSYSLVSVTDTNGCAATALLGLSDIIVNPKPDVDQPTSIVVCQNSTVPTVLFTGTVPNTVYDWTGTSSSIGLATSGTDSIGSFVAVNNTASPIVDTITVTPSYTDLGTTCLGTPKTFTITVNPGPVAVCKSTTVSLDSAGNASIIAADVDGGSTASCGIQSITVSKSAFTCANVGLDSVVLTVTDSSGNTASCTAYVTVQDTTKPVITCPADIAVYSDSGVCGATVSFVVSGTDNCGTPTIVSSYASGSIFPVGVTTVNDTAFDASGNKSVCSFTVTVTDTTKPIITCPADFTLYTNQFNCGVYELFLDSATATDACGVSVTSPQQNGDFPVGVNVITWIATDANGNVDSCHQILTVVDTIKPEIVCPANIAVNNDSGVCGAIVNFSSNVSDNCEVDTTIASPASGSFFPVGTTTVNYTATDIHGNTSTCSFTVTVTDTTKPVIVCPSNITVSNDSGICGAKVSFSVTATDNCSLATVVSSPSSGSTFPVGTTIVSDTATDIYGNVSVCTFTVTVSDTTKPSITCAADTVLNPDGGSCFATATLNVPLVSDNCGIDDLFSDVSAPFAQGNTVVTWTVIDNNGNQNTCLQNVYVNNTDTLKGDKLDSICPYTQYDLTAQTFNGVSGSDIDWSLSTASPSSVDTGTFLGVYTLANGGCKDTVAVTVIYRFKPDIGPDQADSICLFTTYDLNSLDYSGFSPLVWNTPNPGAVSPGVYTGVYTSPISGCTDTVVVTITYKVKPDVGVDRALILCDNTTLDLNSLIYNNLSPLVWDTPNPSAVSAGVFTGVYTAPNGCTDSVVVTTTLRTSPNLGADVVDSICTNSTVDLGAYGFNGYTPLAWSTKLLGTIVGPGNYTGVYIDPVSNCRDSVLVSILPKFTPDLGRDFGDSVCGGTTFDLTALAPNGFTPLVWNTSTPAAVTSGTFTGIYTASNSCADTIDVTINIRVKPDLGPDKTDSICADLKYNLNTLSFNGLSPLNWQGVQDPTSVSPGASYTAIYVAPNSCADTAVATIVAKALPLQPAAFTASSAVICQGIGKVTYTVPNDPAVTYEWSYSGFGVNIIGSGNSVQLDFAPFATAGTLSVVAVAKNGCGKSIARTTDIVVNHEPVVTIISSEADNSICFGQTVVFTAHGAGTYEFFLNGRSQGIAKDSTFTFTGSVEGTNSIYVIGTNACGSDTSETLLLDVHENPVVDAGLDTLISKGNSVQLQGTATGVPPFYFNWTPSLTLNSANIPNPIATPLDDTEYYLTVANQYGCTATDSVRVRVVLDEVYEFPTLITPNGDGSNDYWIIDLDRFPGSDLIIFNRWGQIVYENGGYDNTWNGTYKGTGKDCDDGTYYFIMKAPSLNNKVYKGPINIVRSKK